MMPNFEQFANNAGTTLAEAVNPADTDFDVTDGSVFPSTGNFRVRVGTEIMLVTARSTDTLTVVRAAEGTQAGTYAGTEDIDLILTEAAIERLVADQMALYGTNYLEGPVHSLTDIDGNVLDSSDFTFEQQGSSTVTDLANGSIVMRPQQVAGVVFRNLYRSQPTPPYEVTIGLVMDCHTDSSGVLVGVGFRESSTGRLMSIFLSESNVGSGVEPGTLYISFWNAANSFSHHDLNAGRWSCLPRVIWFRLTNNANLTWDISSNGVSWQKIWQESKTTSFSTAPDQICWGIRPPAYADGQTALTLVHWDEH